MHSKLYLKMSPTCRICKSNLRASAFIILFSVKREEGATTECVSAQTCCGDSQDVAPEFSSPPLPLEIRTPCASI